MRHFEDGDTTRRHLTRQTVALLRVLRDLRPQVQGVIELEQLRLVMIGVPETMYASSESAPPRRNYATVLRIVHVLATGTLL